MRAGAGGGGRRTEVRALAVAGGGGEVELDGEDLEEPRDAGLGVPEELGARRGIEVVAGEVDLGGLASNLEDELGGLAVDEGAGVVYVCACGVVVGSRDAHAALLDVLESQGDLIFPPGLVEAEGAGYQALFEAAEVEVPRIA